MTTRPHVDSGDAKIVPLFTTEEQSASAALSRYWDATLRGQPIDTEELDPELKTVVQLLRHYHAVTRQHHDAQGFLQIPGDDRPPPETRAAAPPAGRHGPRYHASLAAVTMLGVFVLIFAFNTVVSPRSWLLSHASDPDWIPWVSDDWLGLSL